MGPKVKLGSKTVVIVKLESNNGAWLLVGDQLQYHNGPFVLAEEETQHLDALSED